MLSRLCVLVGGLAIAVGHPARAATPEFQQRVEAATRLYRKLDFEDALEQLDKAKRLSSDPRDDVVVALYRGIILLNMGKNTASADAFRTALYLDAEASLPVKVSPRVSADFEN